MLVATRDQQRPLRECISVTIACVQEAAGFELQSASRAHLLVGALARLDGVLGGLHEGVVCAQQGKAQ